MPMSLELSFFAVNAAKGKRMDVDSLKKVNNFMLTRDIKSKQYPHSGVARKIYVGAWLPNKELSREPIQKKQRSKMKILTISSIRKHGISATF